MNGIGALVRVMGELDSSLLLSCDTVRYQQSAAQKRAVTINDHDGTLILDFSLQNYEKEVGFCCLEAT